MYSCNKNTANNLLLVLSKFQKKKHVYNRKNNSKQCLKSMKSIILLIKILFEQCFNQTKYHH